MADNLTKTPVPARVREGDVLSASWLNQAVDFMQELAERSAAATSGNDSDMTASVSSTSLWHDTKARPYDDDEIMVFYHRDFELRLKPDDEEVRAVQMRCGRIKDYFGHTIGLLDKLSDDDTAPDSDEDSEEKAWITLGEAANGVDVYVVIKQSSTGRIKEVLVSDSPVDEVQWEPVEEPYVGTWSIDPPEDGGSGSDDGPGTEGVQCIFIGRVRREANDEDEARFYIEQHHLGPIELQTVNVARLEEKEGSRDAEGSGGSEEARPIGLFRGRKNNTFYFKNLLGKEGVKLGDGNNITFTLNRANYTPSSDEGSGDGGGTASWGSSEGAGNSDAQRLGGVDSIAYDGSISAPCIQNGAIKISLANAPVATDGEDGGSARAGGVNSVSFDENAEGCKIDVGKIVLPLANSAPAGSGDRPGGVRSIAHDGKAETPCISKGDIKLAVADSIREVLGSIKNVVVEYVPQSTLPMMGSVDPASLNFIRAGELHLSVPYDDRPTPIIPDGSGSGSGSGSLPPGGGSDDDPDPPPDDKECECPEYIFDRTYFNVSQQGKTRFISLNTAAITNLVNECIGEVGVEVNVSGLSEVTEHGQLRVTSAGQGPISALDVESDVAYT